MLSAKEADTLQTLELFAVVWAISHFREPINVVTDSLYVAGVVARIEDAFIKEVRNQRLYQLLMQLNKALHQREQPYAVIHIRSHKWNIGLGEGNQRADELVSTAITVPLPQHVLAQEAHSIFHQNAKGLQKEFHISHAEATAIVRSCPICCHHNGGLGLGTGVNPHGVMANELWQTDVTHVNSFGRLKYVHVTIDTYSHYIWATPQSGERAIHDLSGFQLGGRSHHQNLKVEDIRNPQLQLDGLVRLHQKFLLTFVDRLKSQVERQVQDPEVQAELIKEMAQKNGNGTCRRIILSLPLDPSPSLAQMIEACTKKVELFSASERNPGLTHPKPVAAAAPGARRQPMSSDQLQHIICHRCKRPGHFAKACPENQKHLLIRQ
ncbi:hypothetical protein DUI87_35090 [Hirundo rustica rustica]|uniref:RNA-directed DNA polymerase n=1 Tax=Hirundo rustica rustica TaxID=333673 RepID=A0A3M0INE0_HIRRU|nr:hypothetical protein DUI87_35090 [Hirundo rustica rustica]